MLLDATACADSLWESVYKPPKSAGLVCRDCGKPMYAKVSSNRLRFFAHARRSPTCVSEGESSEHRELKRRIADLIRFHGATAVIEAMPEKGDVGGWRADVLAKTGSGRRIAFEVQLAGMTVDVGNERTAKYARDGIDALWISTRQAHWLSRLPSAHIHVGDDDLLVADRGLARLQGDRWVPAGAVSFDKIVKGLLAGSIVAVPAGNFVEYGVDRAYRVRDAVILVSKADAEEYRVTLEHQRLVREAAEQAVRERAQKYEARRAEHRVHLKRMLVLREQRERLMAAKFPSLASEVELPPQPAAAAPSPPRTKESGAGVNRLCPICGLRVDPVLPRHLLC